MHSNNIVTNQLALFDRKTKIKFELCSTNLGDHRVRISESEGLLGEASRETIFVDADRLDDVVDINRLRRPIAIKIDTQGSEPNVFIGGARTGAIVNWRPISAIIQDLRRHWENPTIGLTYFDVIVRK